MNYDRLSVRDLVGEIVREEKLAHDIGVTGDDWTTLKDLESALRKAVIREASVGTCEWKENEDGMWETSCDNTFVFEEDGPEENGQKFCCYCGKPLRVVPFVYPTEEETP